MVRYHISRNVRILFVGINPHHGSYRRGVPFSNNKTFWYLLNRAGLLEEKEEDLRQDESLQRIYRGEFLSKYRLSFINLIDRPTTDVTELARGEETKGVQRVCRVIRRYKPRVVCFIGKVTFNTFRGSRQSTYGWQKDLFGSRVYVAHFPIRGPGSVRVREFKEIDRQARQTR